MLQPPAPLLIARSLAADVTVFMFVRGQALICLAAVLLSGCASHPAPVQVETAPPPAASPAIRKPDWFERQMTLARAAMRTHKPVGDRAGARQEYYRIALAACTQLDARGLSRHRSRCNTLMQESIAASPAQPQDPLSCDEGGDAPDKITACND